MELDLKMDWYRTLPNSGCWPIIGGGTQFLTRSLFLCLWYSSPHMVNFILIWLAQIVNLLLILQGTKNQSLKRLSKEKRSLQLAFSKHQAINMKGKIIFADHSYKYNYVKYWEEGQVHRE